MAEFISNYIKTELLILIPILWFCGKALKKSRINSSYIPIILGVFGIILAGLYVFSTCSCLCVREILSCLFASITQGLLCAGSSVYANEIIKTVKNGKNSNE